MKLFSAFLLLLISTETFAWKQQDSDNWLLAQEKKGIKIFTKKSRWGKLKDTRAEMVVNYTPQEVLQMLTDVESFTQWMPRCKSAKRLANINENEFIVRLVFNVPWPLRDRECIMRMKVEKTGDGGIVLHQNSEPKYLKNEEGLARIERMNAIWKMTPTDDNRTEILNEYSADAGGDIPDWLVNTQAVENPLQTFSNIRLQLPAITKR